MAAPEIVPPVIWGSTAPGGVGVVGSLANGTPTLSTNPATVAGQTNFLTGWGATAVGYYPALQDLDGQAFYLTSQLDGVIRQGIPQWNSGIAYYTNSIVTYNGLIYISLVDNNGPSGTNPTNSTNWKPIGTGGSRNGNMFRNASFQVAQRGATGTITAGSPAYTLDGWIVGSVTNNVTWTQAYSISNNLQGSMIQLSASSAPTDVFIKQRVESYFVQQGNFGSGVNGGWITVQWTIVNTTGASFTPTITVKIPTAQDNYTSTVTTVTAQALQVCPNNVSTTVSYTFEAGNVDFANGMEVTLDFGGALGTSGYIGVCQADSCFTNYLLVSGLQANPPKPSLKNIAEEVDINQRWAELVGAVDTIMGGITSSTNGQFIYAFKTTKHSSPSIVSSLNPSSCTVQQLGSSSVNVSAIAESVGGTTTNTSVLNATVSGATGGLPAYLIFNSSSSILYSCEL